MLKMLIVEDEDIIRRGLVYTIDWLSLGWMVAASAGDGAAGLELIRAHKPDLVLTDIIMPRLNGMEMLAAARQERLPPFKSVILTSYAEFEYARQAVKLDVSDYLLKPIDEEALKQTVGKIRAEIAAANDRAAADESAAGESAAAAQILDWSFDINGERVKNTHVLQALWAIRDGYGGRLGIESIARRQQVSASYLSRKFKESTGQTFLEFLTRYRLQKAAALLKEGKYRVYEVSDLTGFSDYKHFCTVFKKYTQTSPREFVKHVTGVMKR